MTALARTSSLLLLVACGTAREEAPVIVEVALLGDQPLALCETYRSRIGAYLEACAVPAAQHASWRAQYTETMAAIARMPETQRAVADEMCSSSTRSIQLAIDACATAQELVPVVELPRIGVAECDAYAADSEEVGRCERFDAKTNAHMTKTFRELARSLKKLAPAAATKLCKRLRGDTAVLLAHCRSATMNDRGREASH